MEKGAVVDLPQTSSIHKISAGLGWDASSTQEVDLDVSALLLAGPPARMVDAVFFGNLESKGLQHMGDNLTGEGDGDDELIHVHLEHVPGEVSHIYFVINIYTKGVAFNNVKNSFCRMFTSDGTELARYELGAGQAQSCLIIARLFRAPGDQRWGFQALGSFCRGNTWKDSMKDILPFLTTPPAALQLRGQSTMMLDGSGSVAPVAAPQGGAQAQTVNQVNAAPPPAKEKQCCSIQ